MYFYIDRGRLLADLQDHSAQIRTLKRALRTRWLRPMADEQRELWRLKRRATELCALSAFTRGRFHLVRPPRGAASDWNAAVYHRRVAERLGASYALTPNSCPSPLEPSA
jgi:hypothetical protein